jgi:type I restriction enzyme S subunit
VVFTYEATLHRYAIIPEGFRGCLGRRVALVRPDPERVDSRYLLYYFLSRPWRHVVESKVITGATVDRIPLERFPHFPVALPELRLQRRIADVLSAYDDLIANNLRRSGLLEDAARQLYLEWFGRLRFPGYEHSHLEQGLPLGWQLTTLGALCTDIRETTTPDAVEPSTPYIGLEHMPRRSISLADWGTAEEVTSNKFRFRAGEILFGKIRPYFHKVGIAFVDGVASSDAIVIRPREPGHAGLVLLTVSSDAFVAATAQGMKEGSKMPRADWKQMQAYPVRVPRTGF